MQTLYRMSRYILPVVFFGYAPFANLAYFEEPGTKLAPLNMDVLKGTLTASFDSAYKTAMPHRDASIGLIGAARYVLAGEGRKGVVAGKDGWLFTAEEARAPLKDLTQSLDQIVDIRRQLADRGATLVLVPVPAKMDIEADHASAPELSGYMEQLYGYFVAGLRRRGVEVVDAHSALMALGDDAFFATDTHWTTAGAKVVAETVATSGVIEPGDTAMVVAALPTKTLTGDLVSYVTTDTLAPLIGLPQEHVAPYQANPMQTADLGDLFGPQAIDIVLIGTSYSANPDWSFAAAFSTSDFSDSFSASAKLQSGFAL